MLKCLLPKEQDGLFLFVPRVAEATRGYSNVCRAAEFSKTTPDGLLLIKEPLDDARGFR